MALSAALLTRCDPLPVYLTGLSPDHHLRDKAGTALLLLSSLVVAWLPWDFRALLSTSSLAQVLCLIAWRHPATPTLHLESGWDWVHVLGTTNVPTNQPSDQQVSERRRFLRTDRGHPCQPKPLCLSILPSWPSSTGNQSLLTVVYCTPLLSFRDRLVVRLSVLKRHRQAFGSLCNAYGQRLGHGKAHPFETRDRGKFGPSHLEPQATAFVSLYQLLPASAYVGKGALQLVHPR